MSKLSWGKRAFGLFLLCATTAITVPAQTLTTLHSFDSTDGAYANALVQATDGNLYGTTYLGGANNFGTVFKITPSGTLTTLYSFCSQSGCTDGDNPTGGLIQASDRNFYGTTCGAILCGSNGNGNGGTVFRITPSGTLTTLYSFCSQSGCTDGELPGAGLVQATNGTFYGTTELGGVSGSGTVFKINSSGTLTTLYSFCSESGCADGRYPFAGLVQATDGNFYGTTQNGGASGVYGTVFKITPGGMLTTLYSFCSQTGCTDGIAPFAAPIQATDGNLYGTTSYTEKAGGTIFRITRRGALGTLYTFCLQGDCGADGSGPDAGLAQDTNGTFYGTTDGSGGAKGYGTVFSLSVGLGPFVKTQPTSGKVGKTVKILGTNLTGATSVTFNGTAATFTVISPSLITTTVPSGATTGTVQVVTPSGTLSSNVAFRVLP